MPPTSSPKTLTAHSTKEAIVQTALQLFNAHGVEAVTVRDIAKEMGISHGNLCYHFPRKEDIIIALYAEASGQISGEFLQTMMLAPDSITLEGLLHGITGAFAVQHKYKFLMVDFVNIMRRIPEIHENFQAIFPVFSNAMLQALLVLQKRGIVRRDISHEQLDNLVRLLYVFSDFWLSEVEILYGGASEHNVERFTRLGWSILVPYLTKRGLREYEQVLGG